MASSVHRLSAVLLLASLSWVFALSALAQEEGDATTTTLAGTETTVSEEPATTSGLQPALPIEEEPEAAAEPDWTYRYLIPTALVLAVLIVLVTSIKYFSDVVRKRYRVVKE
jgi:hypothetical protein